MRRGDLSGRAEVAFHHPRIRERLSLLENSLFSIKNLGSVIDDIRYGIGSPPQYLNKSEETVPFVRATDIKDGEVNLGTLLHVSAEQPSRMDKCRLVGGELIIVRSGVNTGDSAVIPPSLANAFAGYDLILTVGADASAKFLSNFLDTEIGRLQLNAVKGRSAQPHLNAEEVAAVQVLLPPIAKQEELVAEMDAARAERKAKLAKADALLASIDDFVLDTLGIAPPRDETRRVFGVRGADIRNLQFSPSRHVPELQSLLNRLRNHAATSKTLGDYVEINPKADTSELDDDDIVGFIPMSVVADGATGEYTLTNRPLKEVRKGYTPFRDGDVLWAKITPCMQNGKSCLVDALPNGVGFGSTEFHVLRVKTDAISREFVKEFVNQKTLRQLATNTFTGSAGQQRVPADFLANLPSPELSKVQQNEIVSEIQSIRSQAHRLRQEAESGWETAKARFEARLLGDA